MIRPVVTVTETVLTVHSNQFPQVYPAAHRVMLAWCEFHGIDPYRVPMCSTIVRNIGGRCVEYDVYQVDEAGVRKALREGDTEPMVERVRAQGETPPLPWPAEVLELAS